MRYFILLLVVSQLACSPSRSILSEIKKSEVELKDHSGFSLYDPATGKYLIDHQSDRYFTPASNTKIFTFYASLLTLGDSIIGLKYIQRNDSLIFWGMADPSLLYKNSFNSDHVLTFLGNRPEKLFFSTSNFKTDVLGPGWAWGDYTYSYSSERTPLPIHGNLITINKTLDSFEVFPPRFVEHFTQATDTLEEAEVIREVDGNQLTYYPGRSSDNEWDVPFRYSSDLVTELLQDTLKRVVEEISWPLPHDAYSLKCVPADSLYKVMMQDSDNFIAEQLLLQVAGVISDTLKPEIAIDYITKNYLMDLPDKPRWVDGSGLSRYNLFTPRSIVKLWDKISTQVPQERLFNLLAVGGQSGTIKNLYKNDEPYIFGKTGTLSNNHSLSGFLRTRKGKIFIFSLMHNNYLAPTSEVRRHMEKILYTIYNKY